MVKFLQTYYFRQLTFINGKNFSINNLQKKKESINMEKTALNKTDKMRK